ncbi:MAG TPA: metallophosphoesterase [Burkholderiaceae bacterium]|nr:metallophosphoesterase [Burkholderiaceae bacterium]
MLIAQLSDVHVRRKGELYKGVVDSNRMFAEAIAHLQSLDRRPDLVLLTGDLVDEGHADEYANLCKLLKALELPYLVVPGNHDERVNFARSGQPHELHRRIRGAVPVFLRAPLKPARTRP